MEYSKFDDHYKHFPYRKDYQNGRTNNGGLDLINNPDSISEITEAKNFPALLGFISELNKADSPYLTLGCEAGQDSPEVFVGYVEFTFKDDRLAQDEKFISAIDTRFNEWTRIEYPQISEVIVRSLCWEYFKITY
ncbi:hypothetical protein, partial [Methylophaga sp. UBA5088]